MSTEGKVDTAVPSPSPPPSSSSALERSLVRKLDFQIVPITLAIYTLSFLDRTNIGQARLQGLQEQLHLSYHDYQVALTILYVPYILFEIPSNLIIKKVGPSRLLPLLLITWGVVATCQGVVKNRAGLYAVRFFLGLAEAGVLPGLAVYITFFYPAKETQLRLALYASGASLAGSFNGLIAAAVNGLNGHKGLLAWSWTMIIEGVVTVFFGLFFLLVMPNSIVEAWWLTKEEKELGHLRLIQSRARRTVTGAGEKDVDVDATECSPPLNPNKGKEKERVDWSEVLRAFKDPFVWLLFCAGFSSATSVFSFAFFAPSIIKSLPLGLTNVQAQLLSVPPFACALLFSIGQAFFSDYYRWRWASVFSSFTVATIGYSIAIASSSHPWTQYAGLIIIATGSYSLPACLITWVLTNTCGHYKRATSIALLIVATNSAGIAGNWLFDPTTEAPQYYRGYGTNLALNVMGMIFSTLADFWVLWERRRRRLGKYDSLMQQLREKGFNEEEIEETLGDRHPKYHLEL